MNEITTWKFFCHL